MKTGKALSIVLSLLLLIVMIIAFTMSGCAGKEEQKKETAEVYDTSKDAVFAYLNIDYPEESGMQDVMNQQVYSIDKIMSPMSILVSYGDSNGIEVAVDSTGAGYVQGVGGVFENDYNQPSGWIYTVNDESSLEAASDYKLKSGDTVTWSYTSFTQ